MTRKTRYRIGDLVLLKNEVNPHFRIWSFTAYFENGDSYIANVNPGAIGLIIDVTTVRGTSYYHIHWIDTKRTNIFFADGIAKFISLLCRASK